MSVPAQASVNRGSVLPLEADLLGTVAFLSNAYHKCWKCLSIFFVEDTVVVSPCVPCFQQWRTKGQNVRYTLLVFGLPGSRGTLAGIPTLSKARHEVKIVLVV